MYDILKHAHSGWRWVVLALLVYAVVNALIKWQSKKPFTPGDRRINLFTLIATHLQLVVGLILYFISPKVQFNAATMKDAALRFFTVEHLTLMLVAIVLITIGNSVAKKAVEDAAKFKKTFIYFLIGLIIILVSIPWPFQNYGAGWF